MTLLSARGLSKSFKRGGRAFPAVDGASLSIGPGELVAVVGRSGSGKTTLLNMLAGLAPPDGGEVLLGGESLYGLPESALAALRNQRIGYLPQGRSLLGSLSALDNVRLPFHLADRPGESSGRAMALLEALSVGYLADSFPTALSGGELRRVALARALMNSPDLVVADEPTSDLDEAGALELMELVSLLAREGKAVLIATHDRMAASKAGRILAMAGGALSEEAGGRLRERGGAGG
jgi:putative ABC transport system ATP-binding protein